MGKTTLWYVGYGGYKGHSSILVSKEAFEPAKAGCVHRIRTISANAAGRAFRNILANYLARNHMECYQYEFEDAETSKKARLFVKDSLKYQTTKVDNLKIVKV